MSCQGRLVKERHLLLLEVPQCNALFLCAVITVSTKTLGNFAPSVLFCFFNLRSLDLHIYILFPSDLFNDVQYAWQATSPWYLTTAGLRFCYREVPASDVKLKR